MASLFCGLKAVCAALPDPRKGRSGNIGMADFGLSAFAMFFMQSASFLLFQRKLEKGRGRSNCQTLFGIEKISSDNYIRDMLDGADRLARALLRGHGASACRTGDARGFRAARRQNAHRPRRDRVFLQPEDRLPALPDAQAQQRQDRELSFHAGCDCGRAGTFEGRPAHAGVHCQTGRGREAGLRAQRRQTLAREACRAPEAPAPGVPGRRSVRLRERGEKARRNRRRLHLHRQGDLAQGAR